MVSKCANPGCAASFRYFHKGQLFRFEKLPASDQIDDNGMKKSVRRLEFYWLCEDCARKMTLAFERGSGISIRPKLTRSATAA